MARSFIESAVLGTLPSLASEWDAHRRTFAPGAGPDDATFLATVRAHVLRLMVDGRIAEVSRYFNALERLLSGADPILRDLLEHHAVASLARDCRASGIDPGRLEPYLGNRARVVWVTTSTSSGD